MPSIQAFSAEAEVAMWTTRQMEFLLGFFDDWFVASWTPEQIFHVLKNFLKAKEIPSIKDVGLVNLF